MEPSETPERRPIPHSGHLGRKYPEHESHNSNSPHGHLHLTFSTSHFVYRSSSAKLRLQQLHFISETQIPLNEARTILNAFKAQELLPFFHSPRKSPPLFISQTSRQQRFTVIARKRHDYPCRRYTWRTLTPPSRAQHRCCRLAMWPRPPSESDPRPQHSRSPRPQNPNIGRGL